MLSLRLEPADAARQQLVLRLGDWRHVCDEYYLLLDRGVAPDDDSPGKVRRVVVRLLEQWRDALAVAAEGTDVFLPFDFADQSTAWLRAHVAPHDVTLQPGWSEVAGWSFFPTDISSHVHALPDFQPLPNVRPIAAPREAWLELIESSLSAMRRPRLPSSPTDPTLIFEHFRGAYATELLTAAVAHFNLFGVLADAPQPFDDLRRHLQLEPRPANVLFTALRAMRLLTLDPDGGLDLTPLARAHLVPGGAFDVGDYIGLAASSPGVLAMVERLRTNRPAGGDSGGDGTAFIYREGVASAMEEATLARHFTLALAGRAKVVAPEFARVAPLADARTLLDVAGGTGLYAIAALQRYPHLTAAVFDRPEVLRTAAEFRDASGVEDRLTLTPGDMFVDAWPPADVILLSNVLHDWDVPECRGLIARAAAALPPGGRLLIHDVFLDDDLGGPLPIALYSAALFTLTEGRAYSVAEYREWAVAAGLAVSGPIPTLVHCGVLIASRP